MVKGFNKLKAERAGTNTLSLYMRLMAGSISYYWAFGLNAILIIRSFSLFFVIKRSTFGLNSD